MRYLHTGTVKRTTESGGGFGTAPTVTTTTRYSGRCDVQDHSAGVRRNLFGDAWQAGSAEVFFPERVFPLDAQVDDEFVATYEGLANREGRVVDIDRVSKSIMVRWL
jgi:hypothetical protein